MLLPKAQPIHQQVEEEDYDVNESGAPLLMPAGGGESCYVSEQHYIESESKKYCIYCLLVWMTKAVMNHCSLLKESHGTSLQRHHSFVPRILTWLTKLDGEQVWSNVTRAPHPSNWTWGQILDWLEGNPVRNNGDIVWMVLTRRLRTTQFCHIKCWQRMKLARAGSVVLLSLCAWSRTTRSVSFSSELMQEHVRY